VKEQNPEQLRTAILIFLAERLATAFSADEIERRIRAANQVDGFFQRQDVAEALALLEGFGLVKKIPRPLSGMHDWKVTSEGVIFKERNYGM